MRGSQTPKAFRKDVAEGRFTTQTSGRCPGFAQVNLVALPSEAADDFSRYAALNPKACPVLERVGPGQRESSLLASGADLARVFPRYRIHRTRLSVIEKNDVSDWWREDLVAFLIGCSFTFESALVDAGIPMRHIDRGTNVAMYITMVDTRPYGRFKGPLVVSMRAIKRRDLERVRDITSRFPGVHGAPIHVGDPEVLGIKDLDQPDFGDPIPVDRDEVPVFWPCGVTPQMAILDAGLDLVITHSPGHMMVTDVRNEELEERP